MNKTIFFDSYLVINNDKPIGLYTSLTDAINESKKVQGRVYKMLRNTKNICFVDNEFKTDTPASTISKK